MDPSMPSARRALLRDLFDQGINDLDVLAAIQNIPREWFVPPDLVDRAYDNTPLPIGMGQTISQPMIVAKMTSALAIEKDSRVLEVGTGSGYQTAILARLAPEVFTIERFDELSRLAMDRLASLGVTNVRSRVGDGTLGWPEAAPFDRIILTAAGPRIPPALVKQLAEGGRLVLPIESTPGVQTLYLFRKHHGELEPQSLGGCRFVRLIGEEGWSENEVR
jgi:protein-L-isoaspartate(D-aspartate) O-methyltransferase